MTNVINNVKDAIRIKKKVGKFSDYNTFISGLSIILVVFVIRIGIRIVFIEYLQFLFKHHVSQISNSFEESFG